MLRTLKILSLHIQEVLQNRTKSIVYILIELVNVLVLIFFWRSSTAVSLADIQSLQTYYLVFLVIGALVMAYPEDGIGSIDIQGGQLSAYLLRPYSYIANKLMREVGWRVLMAFWALVLVLLFMGMGISVAINLPIVMIPVFLISLILGFMVSFYFKVCVGCLAFWTTNIRGINDLTTILTIVCCGYLIPLSMMPDRVMSVLSWTPFPVMISTSVAIIMGTVQGTVAIQALMVQLGWGIFLWMLARVLFALGVRSYTGVGQ